MRGEAADDELGQLVLRQRVDLAEPARYRDHVDRRVAAADADDPTRGHL